MTNKYVTGADFLKWTTPQDQTADTTDDAVISDILDAASRFVDSKTGRTFYPRIETRSFDIPGGRELLVDDDLLSVITLTNGDDTTIASTEYNLFPKNDSPHSGLKLKSTSSEYWQLDTNGGDEWVIDIHGEWAYHNRYAHSGWVSGGTLGAEIADTTTLAFTMTAGHSLVADQIVKIENELYNIDTVASVITPALRGDNGSTAATHANGTTVYIWQPQDDISQAVKLIAQSLYRRFGHPNQSDESIVTASGVVVTPKDVPGIAARAIRLHMRIQ